MQRHSLAERLGRHAALSASEIAALDGLMVGRRTLRRGAVLRAERDPMSEMFVVDRGWLFSSTLLEDGRRQIIRFHVRGDLVGCDMIAFAEAPEAVAALTDAEVALIDVEGLARLFADHPRLAALFYAVAQIDRVTLTDRLTSLGRSSAKGRVAALLLWVVERLRQAGSAGEERFVLPMTQEEIGDAVGLTAVHVNRTLRKLAEQGLIERTRSMVRLVDPERLAQVANQPIRRERLRDDWLR